jgi:very-short-patch-repair endonuclease
VVASHQSALVLHCARLWRADLDVAHVSRVTGDHTRHRPRAIIHPEPALPAVVTSDGLWTVPVALAVVQVGLYPPDLSAQRRPFESLVAADGALHDGLVTVEQLEEAVELLTGHPGIHQVRTLLVHADARHESVGETRLAHVLRRLGYRFTAQVWVSAGGQRWRVDFVLEYEGVIVEFDGLLKYGGATGREALAAEKWREDQLRSEGHQVVRVVWSELDTPDQIGARIEQAASRARMGRSTRSTRLSTGNRNGDSVQAVPISVSPASRG